MREFTKEMIEMMFQEMGLGTQKERNRFINMSSFEFLNNSIMEQLFIRIENFTEQNQEDTNAELA